MNLPCNIGNTSFREIASPLKIIEAWIYYPTLWSKTLQQLSRTLYISPVSRRRQLYNLLACLQRRRPRSWSTPAASRSWQTPSASSSPMTRRKCAAPTHSARWTASQLMITTSTIVNRISKWILMMSFWCDEKLVCLHYTISMCTFWSNIYIFLHEWSCSQNALFL